MTGKGVMRPDWEDVIDKIEIKTQCSAGGVKQVDLICLGKQICSN